MSPSPTPSDPSTATRRTFLKTGTVAAAGLVAAPYAFSRTRAFRETLNIAVIGTGGMGTGHLRSLVNHVKEGHEDLKIVALSDVCKPRLDAAKEIALTQDGVDEVRTYRNYRELLAKEKDVHGVWIASPEHWHSAMAIDAIGAGKDVYLEKPMCLNLDQALKLWRAERTSDRIVQVGTQYTTQPMYHRAQEHVANGTIGHPMWSQTSYCRNVPTGEWMYGIDPQVVPGEMLDWEAWCGEFGPLPFDTELYHRWRRYRRFSTGIVGDLLVHMMTPLVKALDVGWPVRVTATGGHYQDKVMENHDQVNLTIQFEKEHTMIVAGSVMNQTGLETMVRGHKANLYIGGNHCKLVPERPYVDDLEEDDFQYEYEDPQRRHQLDFLKCIRTRERPTSTVDLGTQIMVIVDLATRSMWEGSAFGYNPASMSTFAI